MKELRGIARRQGRWEEEEEKFSETFLNITVWELNPSESRTCASLHRNAR